ncbi:MULTISPECIES: GAP family protein [Nocardia]|uniref:GAP family protein n=1 Tax=Nocardia TaxID=1817 RepID=UPI000D69B776|nr:MULTISPECIES: GAP family protein [Nocardia]
MLTLVLALAGFAFLDSLDVLLVGVTTAVVADSRLARRSPIPGGASFLGGVFAVTTTFGLCTVLGITFLTDLVDFELTPTLRYWGELVIGLTLIGLACVRVAANTEPPAWAKEVRRRPWVLGLMGVAVGLAQAPTAVPYLAALAMISARHPPLWPLIIVVYCALALVPPLLVLLLSVRRSPRARRVYRGVVRFFTRFGPLSVRILFALLGLGLIIDVIRHAGRLW